MEAEVLETQNFKDCHFEADRDAGEGIEELNTNKRWILQKD